MSRARSLLRQLYIDQCLVSGPSVVPCPELLDWIDNAPLLDSLVLPREAVHDTYSTYRDDAVHSPPLAAFFAVLFPICPLKKLSIADCNLRAVDLDLLLEKLSAGTHTLEVLELQGNQLGEQHWDVLLEFFRASPAKIRVTVDSKNDCPAGVLAFFGDLIFSRHQAPVQPSVEEEQVPEPPVVEPSTAVIPRDDEVIDLDAVFSALGRVMEDEPRVTGPFFHYIHRILKEVCEVQDATTSTGSEQPLSTTEQIVRKIGVLSSTYATWRRTCVATEEAPMKLVVGSIYSPDPIPCIVCGSLTAETEEQAMRLHQYLKRVCENVREKERWVPPPRLSFLIALCTQTLGRCRRAPHGSDWEAQGPFLCSEGCSKTLAKVSLWTAAGHFCGLLKHDAPLSTPLPNPPIPICPSQHVLPSIMKSVPTRAYKDSEQTSFISAFDFEVSSKQNAHAISRPLPAGDQSVVQALSFVLAQRLREPVSVPLEYLLLKQTVGERFGQTLRAACITALTSGAIPLRRARKLSVEQQCQEAFGYRPSMCISFVNHQQQLPNAPSPFETIFLYLQEREAPPGFRHSPVLLGVKFRAKWLAASAQTDPKLPLLRVDSGDGDPPSGHVGRAAVAIGVCTRAGSRQVLAWIDGKIFRLHASVVNEGALHYGAYAFIDLPLPRHTEILQSHFKAVSGITRVIPNFPASLVDIPPPYVELFLRLLLTLGRLHDGDSSSHTQEYCRFDDALLRIVRDALKSHPEALENFKVNDARKIIALYRKGYTTVAALWWWGAASIPLIQCATAASRRLFGSNYSALFPTWEAPPLFTDQKQLRTFTIAQCLFEPDNGAILTINGSIEGSATQILRPRNTQRPATRLNFHELWESSRMSPHGMVPFILLDCQTPVSMTTVEIDMLLLRSPHEMPGVPNPRVFHWEVAFSDDNALYVGIPSSAGRIHLDEYENAETKEMARKIYISFGPVGAHRYWRLRFLSGVRRLRKEIFIKTHFPIVNAVEWKHVIPSPLRRCCFHYRDEVIGFVRDSDVFLADLRTGAIVGTPTKIGSGYASAVPFHHIDAAVLIERTKEILLVSSGQVLTIDKWSGQRKSGPIPCEQHDFFAHLPPPFSTHLKAAWPLDMDAQLLFSGSLFCVYDPAMTQFVCPPTPVTELPGTPITNLDLQGNPTQITLEENVASRRFPFDQVDLCCPIPELEGSQQDGSRPRSSYRFTFISRNRFVRWLLPLKENLAGLIAGAKPGIPLAESLSLTGTCLEFAQLQLNYTDLHREFKSRVEQKMRTALQLLDMNDESIQIQCSAGSEFMKDKNLIRRLFREESSLPIDATTTVGSREGITLDVSFPTPRKIAAIEVIADAVGTTWALQCKQVDAGQWVSVASSAQVELLVGSFSSSSIASTAWRLTSNGTPVSNLTKVFLSESSRRSCAPSVLEDFTTVELKRTEVRIEESPVGIGKILHATSFNPEAFLAGVDIVSPFPFSPSYRGLQSLQFRFRGRSELWGNLLDNAPSAPLSASSETSRLPLRWSPKLVRDVEVLSTDAFPQNVQSFALSWRIIPMRPVGLANRPCPTSQSETVLLLSAPSRTLCRCSLEFEPSSGPSVECAVQLYFAVQGGREKIEFRSCAFTACASDAANLQWDSPLDEMIRMKISVVPHRVITKIELFEAVVPSIESVSPSVHAMKGGFSMFNANSWKPHSTDRLSEPVRAPPGPYRFVIQIPRVLAAARMFQGIQILSDVEGPRSFTVATRGFLSQPQAQVQCANSTSEEVRWPLQPVRTVELTHPGDSVVRLTGLALLTDLFAGPVCEQGGLHPPRLTVLFGGREVVIPQSLAPFHNPIPLRVGTSLRYEAQRFSTGYVGLRLCVSGFERPTVDVAFSEDEVSFTTVGQWGPRTNEIIFWPFTGAHKFWRLRCIDAPEESFSMLEKVEWFLPSPCVTSEPFPVTPLVGKILTNAWIMPNADLYASHGVKEVLEPIVWFMPRADAVTGGGRSGASSTTSTTTPAAMYIAVDLFSGPQSFVRLGVRTDRPAKHEMTIQYSDDGDRYTSIAVHQQDAEWCFSSWDWCGSHRYWRVCVSALTGQSRKQRSPRKQVTQSIADSIELTESLVLENVASPVEECGVLSVTWYAATHRSFFPMPADSLDVIHSTRCAPLPRVPNADACAVHSMPIGGGLLHRGVQAPENRVGVPIDSAIDAAIVRATFGKVSPAAVRSASKLEDQLDEQLPTISSPETLLENGKEILKNLFFPDSTLIINRATIQSMIHRFTSSPLVCIRGLLGAHCFGLPTGAQICLVIGYTFSLLETVVASSKPNALIVSILDATSLNSLVLSFPFMKKFSPTMNIPQAARNWTVCHSSCSRIFGGCHQPLHAPRKGEERQTKYEIHLPAGTSLIGVLTTKEMGELIADPEAAVIISALTDAALSPVAETDVVFAKELGAPEGSLTADFVLPLSISGPVHIPSLRFVCQSSPLGIRIDAFGAAVFSMLPGHEFLASACIFLSSKPQDPVAPTPENSILREHRIKFAGTLPQTVRFAGTRNISLSHCAALFEFDIPNRVFEASAITASLWLSPWVSLGCQLIPAEDGNTWELLSVSEQFHREELLSVVRTIASPSVSRVVSEILPFDFALQYLRLGASVPVAALSANPGGTASQYNLILRGEVECHMLGNVGHGYVEIQEGRLHLRLNFSAFNFFSSLHCEATSVELVCTRDGLITFTLKGDLCSKGNSVSIDFVNQKCEGSGKLLDLLNYRMKGALNYPGSKASTIDRIEWVLDPATPELLLSRIQGLNTLHGKVDLSSLGISEARLWEKTSLSNDLAFACDGSLHGCPFSILMPLGQWNPFNPLGAMNTSKSEDFFDELLSTIISSCETSVLMAHTAPQKRTSRPPSASSL